MKTASTTFECKPQSWVTSGIARHIEQFGVPSASATVIVIATLEAWESIRALKPDGSVVFSRDTYRSDTPVNYVRHLLENVLCDKFKETGVVPESIDITDLISEYSQEQQRKTTERAEEERIRAEERLQKEARLKNETETFKKEMAAWIAAHGSERLKFCLAEDIDCEAAYRDERILADRLGWWWDSGLRGSSKAPRNPPIDAFDVLREARKVEPEAALYYHTEEGFYVEDCDGERTGEEVENWRGYVAEAMFLGKTIVFGVPEVYWT